jgi:hypothetical protein
MHWFLTKWKKKQHNTFIPKTKKGVFLSISVTAILIILCVVIVISAIIHNSAQAVRATAILPMQHPVEIPTPTPPFNPNVGAVLPTHRIVAFYGIPGAEPAGPAYQLNATMLQHLQTQAAAYQKIDPSHPVMGGIDLVVSVPDGAPGPNGTYSHHVDPQTIQSYIDFCQQHNLLLFLDLNFGQAPIMPEVNFFLPYLEKYSFVEMAIDPEWMFPQKNGIPGINLSNVTAANLNPIIEAVAAIPMKYHVPRKVLIIHQYRGDGDGLTDPTNAGKAEIADKRNIVSDPRVDVVFHIDSVGNYKGATADKTSQYENWCSSDMQKYHNFQYCGFKLFYNLEKPFGLMTPQQVLTLSPPPMVITYGN